jgi:hypothetical protein
MDSGGFMRISWSIGLSAAVAAVFAHGTVWSGLNLNQPPLSPYQGFFQQLSLAMERLWSYAHGWPPMSHIRDFGQFYAPVVQLTGPLIGFALFSILSRHKPGTHLGKPLAMAWVLTIPSGYIAVVPYHALPWLEGIRTIAMVLLMVWLGGGLRGRGAAQA